MNHMASRQPQAARLQPFEEAREQKRPEALRVWESIKERAAAEPDGARQGGSVKGKWTKHLCFPCQWAAQVGNGTGLPWTLGRLV